MSFLIIICVAELALMIAVFALANPIKAKLSELLKEEAIRDYRDDINRNNIIDWFQEKVMSSNIHVCIQTRMTLILLVFSFILRLGC